jgi:protein-S-isoprenylcysteine O-methyltransferase Ste14
VLAVRATAALVLPITVDGLVPWVLLRDDAMFDGGAAVVGIPLVIAGVLLLVDSVFLRFAREGRGTLAPIDPPRFVVQGGAYRYSRNPMYVANLAILAGIAITFWSLAVAGWGVVMAVAFHLFVISYEEPALRDAFGESYERYQREVPRWLPLPW